MLVAAKAVCSLAASERRAAQLPIPGQGPSKLQSISRSSPIFETGGVPGIQAIPAMHTVPYLIRTVCIRPLPPPLRTHTLPLRTSFLVRAAARLAVQWLSATSCVWSWADWGPPLGSDRPLSMNRYYKYYQALPRLMLDTAASGLAAWDVSLRRDEEGA